MDLSDTSPFSPSLSPLSDPGRKPVPVLEASRPCGVFSSRLYPAKDYFDRSAPANILKCLELDQLISVQRPSLYREQYLTNGLATTDRMHTTDIKGHHGCVNALSFSNLGEEFLVTGGDDERVLVWKVDDVVQGKDLKPVTMSTSHQSNVFSAVFSCDNSYIYSGGNDGDVVQHDLASGRMVNMYPHPDAVYSVAAHPLSPNIIITASEDGFVRTIDTRMPRLTLDMLLTGRMGVCVYQTVAINPVEPRLIAIGSTKNGSELFDTRQRKQVIHYKSTRWVIPQDDVVSVCFNNSGTQLFTMLRQLPPCLYDIWNKEPKCLFMDNSGAYRNSVTMKSGCFLGLRDEFVVSGSDDFRIYIWKIPQDAPGPVAAAAAAPQQATPHLIIPGHRSIVNQIRYSPTHHIMCSSGVEKVVKLWSHLPLFAKGEVQYSGNPPSRRKYTRLEFIRITLEEDERGGNGSADPLQEDQQVLAFFDSLVDQDDQDLSNLLNSSSDNSSTSSDLSSFVQSDSSSMDHSPHIHWIDRPSLSPRSTGSTPQSLSPANTSSLEPPWSDLEERWDEYSDNENGSEGSDEDREHEGEKELSKEGEFLVLGNSSEACRTNGMEYGMSLETVASSSGEDGERGASTPSRKSKGKKPHYTKEYFLKTVPPSKFYPSSSQDMMGEAGPSSGASPLRAEDGDSHIGQTEGDDYIQQNHKTEEEDSIGQTYKTEGGDSHIEQTYKTEGGDHIEQTYKTEGGDFREQTYKTEGGDFREQTYKTEGGDFREQTYKTEGGDHIEQTYKTEGGDHIEQTYKTEGGDHIEQTYKTEGEDPHIDNHKTECSVTDQEISIVDSESIDETHMQENGATSGSLTEQDEDMLTTSHSTS